MQSKKTELSVSKIELFNFKGSGVRTFVFDGNTNIYGANRAGKTTVFDAFCWITENRDSSGRSDFEIKTQNQDGTTKEKMDHGVAVTINGRCFKRIHRDVWKKKTGDLEESKSGNENVYSVDDVPKSETEFNAMLYAMHGTPYFRLLSDPTFAPKMPWKELRNAIISICGDVDDADVIASNGALKDVPNIIGSRTIDDYREWATAQKKRINKESTEVRGRMAESTMQSGTKPPLPESELRAFVESGEKKRDDQIQLLATMKSGAAITEAKLGLATFRTAKAQWMSDQSSSMSARRSAKQSEIDQLLVAFRKSASEDYDKYTAHADSIRDQGRKLKSERDETDAAKATAESVVKVQTANVERILAMLKTAKESSASVMESCPTCNQPIAEEKRQSAIESFNVAKSETIKSLNAQGKEANELRKANIAIIAECETRSSELTSAIHELKIKATSAIESADKALAKSRAIPTESDEVYAQFAVLQQELAAIADYSDPYPDDHLIAKAESEIASLENDSLAKASEVQSAIDDIASKLAAARDGIAYYAEQASRESRSATLSEQDKALAEEFQSMERGLHLTGEFIKAKVKLLTNKINSKFKMAQWKLFETLVNGAVKECCIPTFDGVSYANLNTEAKLNVGLDIINTFAEYASVSVPVWIDNAESVTNIIPTIGQQIRLIVSPSDTTLRVEAA